MPPVAMEPPKRPAVGQDMNGTTESSAKRIRSVNGSSQQPSAFEEELQKLTQEIREEGNGELFFVGLFVHRFH